MEEKILRKIQALKKQLILSSITLALILSGITFIISNSTNVLADDTGTAEAESTAIRTYKLGEPLTIPIYLSGDTNKTEIGTYTTPPITKDSINNYNSSPEPGTPNGSLYFDGTKLPDSYNGHSIKLSLPLGPINIYFFNVTDSTYQIGDIKGPSDSYAIPASLDSATIAINLITDDSNKPFLTTTVDYTKGNNSYHDLLTKEIYPYTKKAPVGYYLTNDIDVKTPILSPNDLTQNIQLEKDGTYTWTFNTYVNGKLSKTQTVHPLTYQSLDDIISPMPAPSGYEPNKADSEKTKIYLKDSNGNPIAGSDPNGYGLEEIKSLLGLQTVTTNDSDPVSYITSLNNAYLDYWAKVTGHTLPSYKNILTSLYPPLLQNITIDQYYTVKNTNTSGGGSSSSSNNFNITDKKQLVSTFLTHSPAKLYTINGDRLSSNNSFSLSPGTDWVSDKTATRDGATYYRVATDAWVKSSDVYQYVPQDSIVTTDNKLTYLLHGDASSVHNRGLDKNSSWKSDRIAYLSGYNTTTKFYRVATDEFVAADDIVK